MRAAPICQPAVLRSPVSCSATGAAERGSANSTLMMGPNSAGITTYGSPGETSEAKKPQPRLPAYRLASLGSSSTDLRSARSAVASPVPRISLTPRSLTICSMTCGQKLTAYLPRPAPASAMPITPILCRRRQRRVDKFRASAEARWIRRRRDSVSPGGSRQHNTGGVDCQMWLSSDDGDSAPRQPDETSTRRARRPAQPRAHRRHDCSDKHPVPDS